MNISVKRLLFYWVTSFIIASFSYYLLWLITPGHRVFGSLYRMFLYHYAYPMQYIAIPCFFYGIIASLLANKFEKKERKGRILLTVLIVALTILLSSPLGGMLWHFHDMQAGYFPKDWISKMVIKGSSWGLSIGWLIVVLSIPYNIFGSIITFYLTKKGIELFKPAYKQSHIQ